MKIGNLEISWNKKSLKTLLNRIQLFGFTTNWGDNKGIDAYSKNASLYAVINRITRTAATAPFKVYKVKNKSKFAKYKAWTGANATKESLQLAMFIKKQVFEEDNKHPLNELIDRCGKDFIANSIGFKLLTGNRFWWITKLEGGVDKGKVWTIQNLPPNAMTIRGDGTLYGVKEYTLMLGTTTVFQPEEIIHSKYWNPNITSTGEHLLGLSPLEAASRNLTRVDAGLDRSVAMLQNAGAAGLVYNKELASLSAEDAEKIKKKINTEILGTENAGKIAIANGDMGYINFGLSAVEMNVLEMEKYSLQQICNVFGVPYALFSTDKATYNNVQEAKKELITMAVIPELASIRDDFNVIAKSYAEDIYVDYDISVYPELQEDLEKTARIMASAWWIKGNEKRLAMQLDEDTAEPMMNTYILPSGMQDIKQLGTLDNEMNVIDDELNNAKP